VGNSKMLANLEALIRRIPDSQTILAERRTMIKRMMAARAEVSKSA